jgi:hypothetical protein
MYGDDAAAGGALASIMGGMCCYFVVIIALVVLIYGAWWKLFAMAGKPGWAALIPIYNLYMITQIVGREGWWVFVYWLVPVFGWFMVCYDLARSYGKDTGYAVGMFLLGVLFFPMLGFGKETRYVGPAAGGATPPPPSYPTAPPTYTPPAPPAG